MAGASCVAMGMGNLARWCLSPLGVLAHLVQPADGSALCCMAERLQFLIPCLTEGKGQLVVDGGGIAGAGLVGVPDAVLGHHDIAVDIRHRMENSQFGRVRPAAA